MISLIDLPDRYPGGDIQRQLIKELKMIYPHNNFKTIYFIQYFFKSIRNNLQKAGTTKTITNMSSQLTRIFIIRFYFA